MPGVISGGVIRGVQLSLLGFAACHSKNCTNLTNSLTTLLVQLSLRGCSCLNCTP